MYVRKNEKNEEICEIKYSSFNRKSLRTNVSLAETNYLSSHRENMYSHINPRPY